MFIENNQKLITFVIRRRIIAFTLLQLIKWLTTEVVIACLIKSGGGGRIESQNNIIYFIDNRAVL